MLLRSAEAKRRFWGLGEVLAPLKMSARSASAPGREDDAGEIGRPIANAAANVHIERVRDFSLTLSFRPATAFSQELAKIRI
jgi:hypothetical protein